LICTQLLLAFYRASSYARAVLAVVILSVCPSVRPSATRVLCDKTKQCTAFFDGSVWVQISNGRKRRSPTTVRVRKLEWLPFRAVSKTSQLIALCDHNSPTSQTEGQADGQTSCSWHKRNVRLHMSR